MPTPMGVMGHRSSASDSLLRLCNANRATTPSSPLNPPVTAISCDGHSEPYHGPGPSAGQTTPSPYHPGSPLSGCRPRNSPDR